jgi:hypothetical protein
MAIDRIDYLLQKCKLQLRKKRDSEARVWLEIALDEFPNNRELQRFAGRTYLQWGMTQKAIHFLEIEHTVDTFYDFAEGYDHDHITQEDLSIIQEQFNSTKPPSFVFPPQDIEKATFTGKTLTLKKNVVPSEERNVEADSICLNRSGQKQVVVKHLKTRKISNFSGIAVGNKNSSRKDPEPSKTEIEAEDKNTILQQEVCTYLDPSLAVVVEDDFDSPSIYELQDVPEYYDPTTNEVVDTKGKLSVFNTESELPYESKYDVFDEAFNTEEEITQYGIAQAGDSDHVLPFQDTFQSENDELEWEQDPTGLEFYQDNEVLFDFDEEGCELFDVTDDAFISAFEEFDFDEEQQSIDDANDGDKLKLTRWERAQQVAVEVIYSTNWSGKHLTFLTDVFFESGWGAARITMEKEILSGTTIDELILARDFKEIWKNCDRYWITLSKLGPTAHVTEATHRQMSWVQALKIIRCFNWLPSIEELEVFLEDEFEYWYQHALMRRIFPVFMKYFCYYRAKNDPYMDFELGPYQAELTDDPMDNGDFINCNSENRQRLSEVGLDAVTVNIY